MVLTIDDLEKFGDRVIKLMGTIEMLLDGTIPLFATLGVERGWWNSFRNYWRKIASVFIIGGTLHFVFLI